MQCTDNPHETVNVRICARRTTQHDLVSVIPDEIREREREIKPEKEKSVTVVFSCGHSFFGTNNRCLIFLFFFLRNWLWN